MSFIPGLDLARAFHDECVAPAVRQCAPNLRYAAALIGEGSEVLGYDTPISADHDWGPRVLLFVEPSDLEAVAESLLTFLDRHLPDQFQGWPVSFPDRDRPTGIDRAAGAAGSPRHGVEIHDLSAWVRRRLGSGFVDDQAPSPIEWLGTPEQALLALTAGAVFRDDLDALRTLRRRLAWFPRDVWLFKLGCQWARVGEEAAFVGRCGEIGDDIGSRLVTARLVHDSMRIALLMARRYAPYAKWFGRAFSETAPAEGVSERLEAALAAADWRDRELFLNDALSHLARRHLALNLPGAVAPRVSLYHQRPFQVINAAEIAEAIFEAIEDPVLLGLARTGGIDQFSDSTAVLSHPRRARDVTFAALGAGDP